MLKRVFLVILFFSTVLFQTVQTASAEPGNELTVSVAASLKNVFEEIGRLFESKHKDVKLLFNFGGSGDLEKQIEGGAPVDIFAPAALKDMDELDKKGLIAAGSKLNFAEISIVLIRPVNSKLRITSFRDLGKPEVKRIAIGNTKSVPAGRYAEETLRFYKLFDILRTKYVYAENCRQVLDYVGRGEADAGIVYLTDALARPNEVEVVMKAPRESHQPVIYSLGIISGSKKEALARAFIKLVNSEEGINILRKSGFQTYGK